MKLHKAKKVLKQQHKTSAIVRTLGKANRFTIVTGTNKVVQMLQYAPSRVMQVR